MVTCPEVFYAGTPTSLAVSLLADFPARVTAELKYGDNTLAQTEDVYEGETTADSLFIVSDLTRSLLFFHF